MINETELNISNKSYINKDFPAIYDELLELVQNMTNRWNPETSNESDPGVVLLKLLGFIGDKLNYNVDKNVLECFMPSATQLSSMRKLCDMMGYNMKYYMAPTTKVTFMYTGSKLSEDGSDSIKFNALETQIGSKEDSSVSFYLTQPVQLDRPNSALTGLAIGGILKDLLVNTSGNVIDENYDNTLIQLVNLDDNNRIYFPEINVAQNGVFVANDSSEDKYWDEVENLNYQIPGEKCFKFGFDSTVNLPYIEFPKDISELIENGLRVKYIVTSGVSDNVSAGTLNVLLASNDIEGFDFGSEGEDVDYLYIKNASGSINGANPETINEAYNSFKKVIGTFDTLVTCRDYANAIYQLYDSANEYPLVSNIQVSDRRDDFNYSTRIVSFDRFGEFMDNISSDGITAYELCCYPLNPLYNYTINDYNNSFLPLSGGLTSEIKSDIEGQKTISHDYKTLKSSDVWLFQNRMGINANLTTKYKVNDSERVEIVNNVATRLMKDYNARNVDYGYEIPYDSLLESIEDADERISSVSLAEPELTTWYITADGTQHKLISQDGMNVYIDYLAKNILNGNISLFDFDTRFDYDLGHKKISGKPMVSEKVKSIDSELNLVFETGESSTEKTLRKNEVVQFVGPSILTDYTYPAYVYYRFEASDTHEPIKSGTNYQLRVGETLRVRYTDSEDNVIKVVYTCVSAGNYTATKTINSSAGSPQKFSGIIQPNGFDLLPISQMTSGLSQKDGLQYASLNAKETIGIQKVNIVTLDSRTPCYWLVRQDADNKTSIPWDPVVTDHYYKYMLQDDEYFFYSDTAFTTLVTVGSGTTLEFVSGTMNPETGVWSGDSNDANTVFGSVEIIDIDSILEDGILAIKDKCKYIQFSAKKNPSTGTRLVLQENSILTLTEKDKVQITGLTGSSALVLNNDLQDLSDEAQVTYTIDGEESTSLPQYIGLSKGWQIKSRLDINVTKDEPQVIDTTNGQSIKFTISGNPDTEIILNDDGQYFNLSAQLQKAGSKNISLASGTTENPYPVSLYCYELTLDDGDPVAPSLNPGRSAEGYAVYDSSELESGITFDMPIIDSEDAVIMIHVQTIAGEGSVSLTGSNYTIKNYYNDTSIVGALAEGINVLKLHNTGSVGTVTLTASNDDDYKAVITVGTLDFYKGFNPQLGLEEFSEEVSGVSLAQLETALKTALDDYSTFYFNNKIDNSKYIEVDNLEGGLLSPYAFFDANNRANKFILPKIDFYANDEQTGNVHIDVVRSSRL